MLTFEVDLDASVRAQPAFEALGATVTQTDFPAILESIRNAARLEFGPRADVPGGESLAVD